MKETKERLVLTKIEHLKEQLPWTMGLAGLARLVTWESKNVLGVSKNEMVEKIIGWVLEYQKERSDETVPPTEKEILVYCKAQIDGEMANSTVDKIYDKKKNKLLIRPMEAQRRMRCFSEEFLNKEFDVFLSLLPDHAINDYLKSFFPSVCEEAKWNLFGLSNDFETAVSIKYMYHDTLLYSHETSHLVSIELKFDTDLSDNQLLKYAFMMADLEDKGKIAKECTHDFLVISQELKKKHKFLSRSPSEIREMALDLIDDPLKKRYPKKPKGEVFKKKIEALVPRTRAILQDMNIHLTDWQKFGDHFAAIHDGIVRTDTNETYEKLIRGFLESLETKFSHKNQARLFVRRSVADKVN
ncbi:MAG: hypothetical protein HN531_15060 [Opitutae bacterium]|nr:hypothetical protein [Opitutae bacterium]